MKKICRYLFHVLAHIYWSHYKETVAMDLHGHLNTLYTHFMVFIREFNLMDPKETSMMDDLTEALCTPLPPQPQNHVTERWGPAPLHLWPAKPGFRRTAGTHRPSPSQNIALFRTQCKERSARPLAEWPQTRPSYPLTKNNLTMLRFPLSSLVFASVWCSSSLSWFHKGVGLVLVYGIKVSFSFL